MEEEILEKLITNLLNVNVFSSEINDQIVQYINLKFNEFKSDKFNEDFFNKFLFDIDNNTYYEIVDNFKIRLFVFKYNFRVFLIGPYIKKRIEDNEINQLIIKESIPSIYLNQLKNLYYSCSILDSYHIENVINNCIKSINKDDIIFKYQRIENKENSKENIVFSTEINQNSNEFIYKKYELENSFLYKIEHGLVDELRGSFLEMVDLKEDDFLQEYLFKNPQSSLASLRTLARKAAEKSGLSVIVIDRIISKYTQLMSSSNNEKELIQYCIGMMVELTKEVQIYLLSNHGKTEIIKKVSEYLYVNYNEEFSLNRIATKFNVNQYYLVHLFKKEIGITMVEYLEKIRIEKAKELLKNSDFSISEIANLVGYIDNNYFTKVFKKNTGLTPLKYKNSK